MKKNHCLQYTVTHSIHFTKQSRYNLNEIVRGIVSNERHGLLFSLLLNEYSGLLFSIVLNERSGLLFSLLLNESSGTC